MDNAGERRQAWSLEVGGGWRALRWAALLVTVAASDLEV